MELQRNTINESAQQSALESLLTGRTELAETRLAVTAVQIVERMRIRAKNLRQLMDEELFIDNKLLQVQGQFSTRQYSIGHNHELMGLEAQLEQRNSQIQRAQRGEDIECWRDLTHVMRDFLNAWEGFSRNAAKNRFLEALPSSNAKQQARLNFSPAPAENRPTAYSTIYNDNPIIPYTPY